jgi:hypothetical protein
MRPNRSQIRFLSAFLMQLSATLSTITGTQESMKQVIISDKLGVPLFLGSHKKASRREENATLPPRRNTSPTCRLRGHDTADQAKRP